MKTNLIQRLKRIFYIIFFTALITAFSACSDDTQPTGINQNSEGTTITPVGTPNGVPVTATIGQSGGSIISADSSFEIVIPAGALSSNTVITVQPVENFCFNGHGDAIRLTPEGQQFSQQVTVKFHYSPEVLAATYDILMGITRQDGTGRWHCFNNSISNDTVNRVISASITQFGSPGDNITGGDNSTGGGDISFFDIAHIEPRSGNVPVNNNLGMTVTYEALPGGEDDVLTYLPKPIESWSVNSIPNGNSTFGTIINRHGQSATFKAPSQVPNPDVVLVGALINTRFNRRGQAIEAYLLQSPVKITPAIVEYDMKIDMEWPDFMWGAIEYHCTFYDGADMILKVNHGVFPPTASIYNITNRQPDVVPPSGTYPGGQGSITWISDGVGIINILGIAGSLVHGDTVDFDFSHLPVLNPKFHCVPPIGEPYDVGGTPGIAFPTSSIRLRIRNNVQFFTIENEHITIRLTPRN